MENSSKLQIKFKVSHKRSKQLVLWLPMDLTYSPTHSRSNLVTWQDILGLFNAKSASSVCSNLELNQVLQFGFIISIILYRRQHGYFQSCILQLEHFHQNNTEADTLKPRAPLGWNLCNLRDPTKLGELCMFTFKWGLWPISCLQLD